MPIWKYWRNEPVTHHPSPVTGVMAFCLWVLLLIAPAAPASEFKACLGKLRGEAAAQGISPQMFDVVMDGVEPDESVLKAMDYQPEFTVPVWDYVASFVDEQRIADGQAKLNEWAEVLSEVERQFGVDRHVVVALWGVETDYGRILGRRPLMRSLATTSCFGRRQPFFRGELMAALRILQDGDMPPEALAGSWAGAFGQTQFMPSTFQRLAVDVDGDGHRNIVSSVPDALGSAANYLQDAGWLSSEPWGYEVRLPQNYNGPAGRRARRELEEWSRLGIRQIDGAAVVGNGRAALLLPAGEDGPAFMVFGNFDAIHSYNPSESYALSIAHLSDRLRGAGPFKTPWPTDDLGLARAERRELQKLLIKNGYDIGEADGIIGSRTRAAIEAFQESAGLPVDGHPGQKVLGALREASR
ncbi:MAG: lytic murein transglycosylase [Betaproteobacteria bacterium]|nr:lytic murein transglycosylase [Betaproteobacteria bacterium]